MCGPLHRPQARTPMIRDELAALHDAIDTVLTWPPAVLAEVARWLSPAAPQPGNGLDPHPPSITPRSGESTATPSVAVLSERPAKARRGKPTPTQAAERRLLTAMQANPGLSVIALANAANASRSATGERLRQLARRGDGREGRRRAVAAGGGRGAPKAARSDAPPAAAPARWIRNVNDYGRPYDNRSPRVAPRLAPALTIYA